MDAPWNLLVALAALALGYVLFPVASTTFFHYRGTRTLRCPETEKDAGVQIDARRAALGSIFGRTHLRVQNCSLWPARQRCAQGCLKHL